MSKLMKDIQGPIGTFRVDKQDDFGLAGGVWSVEEVLADGPSAFGDSFVASFQTITEAVECAHRMAGLPPITYQYDPPIPKVDRRGLVAHSRKLCLVT